MLQSLRVRLLLLVVLASLPAFIWFVFTAAADRRQAAAEAQADALRIARRAASQQTQFVDQARELLKELAHQTQSKRGNPPLCAEVYPALQLHFDLSVPRYLNLGLIDPAGQIYCEVTLIGGTTQVADRPYFTRAQSTLDFAVGDFEFDETTGQAFVNFGYPLLDFTGHIRAVFFATLDLNWLNEFHSETLLPEGSTFTVLDRNGTILLRNPNPQFWVGQQIPQSAMVAAIRVEQGEGVTEGLDEDGVRRLYAFAPLRGDPGAEVYVGLGVPAADVYRRADAGLTRSLMGLGAVTAGLLIGAWFGGDFFVLRQMRALLRATRQVSEGDLDARTGLDRTAGEFGQLGRAFDAMAAALSQREHQRQEAEAAVQRQAARAEALARVAARLNAQLDLETVLQAVCEETTLALHVSLAVVGLFDSRRDELYLAAGQGLGADIPQELPVWPRAVYEAAFRRRGPLIIVPDLGKMAHHLPEAQLYAAAGLRTLLAARLQHKEQLLGLLAIGAFHERRAFTPDEQALLLGIADQAAQAIANARLLAETEHRARELAALYEITHDLSTQQHLPDLLDLILERAAALLGVSSSGLYLFDHRRGDLELIVTHGLATQPGDRMTLGEGLVGQVAQSRKPVVVNNYQVWEHRLRVNAEPGLTAVMAVPVLYGGELIGVMAVGEAGMLAPSRMFTEADVRLLALIAGHAASAIRNTRLFEAEQLARRTAETLRRANLALTRRLDLDAVLKTLLDYLSHLVPYDTANIMLLEADTRLVVRAARGYETWAHTPPFPSVTFDLEFLPVNRAVVREMVSRVIPDTVEEPEWKWLPGGEHVRNWLGVPLVAGERALGLFSMDKAQPHFFTTEHQQMAEAIASQAAIAIQNAQLYEEVRTGQERLRQLAQQVVVAQEAERQRVSRELHDEAGQALVALKFQLEMVRDDLPREARQLAARIDTTAGLIETTMHRIRLLAHDLRPPALETVGLNRVLEDMCYEIAGRTRLVIDYTGEDLPDLTSAMSIGLYRILQEALTNVVKHARACTVRVTLKRENRCAHLCVEDDGQGFEWAARPTAPAGNGIGLIGMRERVQLLRGELVFEARPGGGTRLMARVPFPTEG